MDYVNSGALRGHVVAAPLPVLLELRNPMAFPCSPLKPTGDLFGTRFFLVEALAPTEERHGVLVQVHDLGILIRGTSGW